MLPAQHLFSVYLFLADSGDGSKGIVTKPHLAPLDKTPGPKGGLAVLASALISAGGLQAQGSVSWLTESRTSSLSQGLTSDPLGQADTQPNRQVKLLLCRDFIRTRENAFYSCITHVAFVFSCD